MKVLALSQVLRTHTLTEKKRRGFPDLEVCLVSKLVHFCLPQFRDLHMSFIRGTGSFGVLMGLDP